MKDRLESISKLVPALTLLCYVCGFVVYNTHLGHYGIIDVEIFNLRYIVAGLCLSIYVLNQSERRGFILLTYTYGFFPLAWVRFLFLGLHLNTLKKKSAADNFIKKS